MLSEALSARALIKQKKLEWQSQFQMTCFSATGGDDQSELPHHFVFLKEAKPASNRGHSLEARPSGRAWAWRGCGASWIVGRTVLPTLVAPWQRKRRLAERQSGLHIQSSWSTHGNESCRGMGSPCWSACERIQACNIPWHDAVGIFSQLGNSRRRSSRRQTCCMSFPDHCRSFSGP